MYLPLSQAFFLFQLNSSLYKENIMGFGFFLFNVLHQIKQKNNKIKMIE